MKKNFYQLSRQKILVAFLIVTLFYSCKKNEVSEHLTPMHKGDSIRETKGVLRFDNESTFNKTLKIY